MEKNILSVTFHAENSVILDWEKYMNQILVPYTKKYAQKYIFSHVKTEMLSEGKNYNLLLWFSENEEKNSFMETHLQKMSEEISHRFLGKVMVFVTELNPFDSSN